MIPIEGLHEIASDYDGMLIDQFGVLHDGAKLYPGALDVLAKLHEKKIPVAIMTNSGKRTVANVARLTKMGIPREFYVDAVSSGEVAYQRLKSSRSRRAFIIGKDGDPANMIYFGVLAVGIIGVFIARFQPQGMARAMFAMALAQALVTVIALIAGLGYPWSGPLELLALNGFFIALWLITAWLFRKAARGGAKRGAV